MGKALCAHVLPFLGLTTCQVNKPGTLVPDYQVPVHKKIVPTCGSNRWLDSVLFSKESCREGRGGQIDMSGKVLLPPWEIELWYEAALACEALQFDVHSTQTITMLAILTSGVIRAAKSYCE